MIRLVCWGIRQLMRFGKVVVRSMTMGLQLCYVVGLILGGFAAHLEVLRWIAAAVGLQDNPYEWHFALHRYGYVWRLLVWYGAFVWLGYVLPNSRRSTPGQRRRRSDHPLPLVGVHVAVWLLVWGPLAMRCGLYTELAPPLMALVVGSLVGTFYMQVCQGLVQPRQPGRRVRSKQASHSRATVSPC